MIVIHRFWTAIEPEKVVDEKTGAYVETGKMRQVDWVEYGPLGSADRTRIPEKVARLSRVAEHTGTNEAAKLAQGIWETIRPHYESWKAGRETPLDGTPLAVWNGVTPEIADFLRSKQVRTVEELAALTDTHITRFGMPGLRDIINQAKRFLAGADTRAAATKIASVEEENARLKADLDELKRLMLEQMREEDEAPVKRGPGRPRKQEEAAA
jgi:hypothetical protein